MDERTTIIIDFDCLFPKLNQFDLDPIEAALEKDAELARRLSSARDHSRFDGSDLRRIWCWYEDTDAMFDEFREEDPDFHNTFQELGINVLMDMATLRDRVESARDPGFYRYLMYQDARDAIAEWRNDNVSMIVIGSSYSRDRMLTALDGGGITSDVRCKRVDYPDPSEKLEKIAQEFDLDLHASILVGSFPGGSLRSAAKQLSIIPFMLDRNGAPGHSRDTGDQVVFGRLTELLTLIRSTVIDRGEAVV